MKKVARIVFILAATIMLLQACSDNTESFQDVNDMLMRSSKAEKVKDYMKPGNKLNKKKYLLSENKKYQFILQKDGNLVLSDLDQNIFLWTSDTAGTKAKKFIFLKDGNLILIDKEKETVWESETYDSKATLLKLNNDGTLVLYKKDKVIWSAGTVVSPCNNNEPCVVTEKESYTTDEPIVINYYNLPGNKRDWIGLFEKDASNQEYLDWEYTDGNINGTVTFNSDLSTGSYEARVFFDDSYNMLHKVSFIITDGFMDEDKDGVEDLLDNCPKDYNPEQEDMDKDGKGDVCDPDMDGDLIDNDIDNCPEDYNPDQKDTDKDGLGDVCDPDTNIHTISIKGVMHAPGYMDATKKCVSCHGSDLKGSAFAPSCYQCHGVLWNPEPGEGKVLIVGAGITGLYAAHKLNNMGLDVQIIEATNRYGGRMKPLKNFSDFHVEAGGQYLDGGGPESGPGKSCGAGHCHLYTDLNNLPNNRVAAVWADTEDMDEVYDMGKNGKPKLEWGWETEDSDIESVWNFYDKIPEHTKDPSLSVEQYVIEYNGGQDHYNKVKHLYEAYFGNEYGTSNSRVNMYGIAQDNWDYKDSGSWGIYRSNMLDAMTLLYFEPILDKIVYNSPVEKINYSGEKVIATDKNGNTYEGDAILVTVPISILQDEMIDFVPDLPERTVNAYNSIGMDHCMKVILKFSDQWWEDRAWGILPNGAAGTCWTEGLVKDGSNNVIVCMSTGENSEYLNSLGNDGAIVNEVLNELDNMFGDTIATDYFEDAHVENWGDSPYIKGCYPYPTDKSFLPDGTDMGMVLAEPVNNKVFFGNDYTSVIHKATMHGAFEGGSTAAKKINEALNKN